MGNVLGLVGIGVGVMAWLLGADGAASGSESLQRPPNVIVIVADDLGYADLSFLPQSPDDVSTPAIDQLANTGTYFGNAYATAPICSPSRAGLITGRYQQRWGNYWYGQGGLPSEEVTLAHALAQLGYSTTKIGKTHLNGGPAQHPLDHGFEHFLGFIHHTWDYIRLSQLDLDAYRERANGKPLGILNVGPLVRGRDDVASFDNGFTTEIFTDEAVKTIKKNSKSNTPFFIELEHNAVHMPTYVTDATYAKRAGFEAEVWDRDAPEWKFPYWDPNQISWGDWHKKWGHLGEVDLLGRKRYIANLLALDDSVGAILQTLEETRQKENTIVVFLSDNGGTINTYSNNMPLRGYKYMFGEGGIRIPMIISWPSQLDQGQTENSLTSAMDVVPTVMELVGGTPLPDRDGISLVNALRSHENSLTQEAKDEHDSAESGDLGHDHLCWAKGKTGDTWVVRSGPWKLIQSEGWVHSNYQLDGQGLARSAPDYEYPAGIQLFNLVDDISETKNLADERPKVVERLTGLFNQWRAEMHATDPPKIRKRPRSSQ